MAELKTSCSKCGGHIVFPKELAGQEIACPHCQETILLPKSKLPTAWIIAAVFAIITVCLASALIWEHHTTSAKLKLGDSVKNYSQVSKDAPTKLDGNGQTGEESEDIQALKNVCRDFYNALNNENFKAFQDVISESSRKVLTAEDVKWIFENGAKYEFLDLDSARFQNGALGKCAVARVKRTAQSSTSPIQEGWKEFKFIKDSDGWKLFPNMEISDAIVAQFSKSGFTDDVKEKIRLLRDGDPFDAWDKNDTNVLAAVFKFIKWSIKYFTHARSYDNLWA